MDGSRGRREDVLRVRFDTHAGQLAADSLTRFRRRVGDKKIGDVVRFHPVECFAGTGNCPVRLVDDAIEIKEYALHDRLLRQGVLAGYSDCCGMG